MYRVTPLDSLDRQRVSLPQEDFDRRSDARRDASHHLTVTSGAWTWRRLTMIDDTRRSWPPYPRHRLRVGCMSVHSASSPISLD
jgi:hypothetical protein